MNTAFITIDNARLYATQMDKYVWVATLLEAHDLPATEARVTWVEDQFDAMLAADNA